ncbi:unnamed protein product [Musa hybrid cultivar]
MNRNRPADPPPLRPPPPHLPVGVRFDPTGIEMLHYFLRPKVHCLPINEERITDLNIYLFHPDHLPINLEGPDRRYAYFFVRREPSEHRQRRRRTPHGYWNQVGLEEAVRDESSNVILGFKRNFVFFEGTKKTLWEMDEYRLNLEIQGMRNTFDHRRNNYVICKVSTETSESSGDLSFASAEAQLIGSDESDSTLAGNKRRRN